MCHIILAEWAVIDSCYCKVTDFTVWFTVLFKPSYRNLNLTKAWLATHPCTIIYARGSRHALVTLFAFGCTGDLGSLYVSTVSTNVLAREEEKEGEKQNIPALPASFPTLIVNICIKWCTICIVNDAQVTRSGGILPALVRRILAGQSVSFLHWGLLQKHFHWLATQ